VARVLKHGNISPNWYVVMCGQWLLKRIAPLYRELVETLH